ncbi:glycosyltransferase [Ancylomarina sp. 16SWW S1-10-2]|uniref:glycosyltransferase n=1 Tax=Ancylomarina sp. 16SWW S1-10-2 TaxID=2499681 RepID=UPI0012AE65A0|nr:glycosyltransferase [Ancylomarina sp. 16SWW S1-10-2]MRT91925.1 glycosyltransferase [Ancylomarina sp. 16SWW S1-10-2]
MLLSIIIPVYNVEKYIYKCLDSIVKQKNNLEEIEVIIVNDGTPDGSMSIVSQFEKSYNNIRVINQSNEGLSGARNKGIENASGDYLWFVDSDDFLTENSLAIVFEEIKRSKVDVLVTLLNRIKENTGNILSENFKTFDGVISGKDYLFQGGESGASQRFIIRRNFIMNHNLRFMPKVLHEDAEFGPRMLYLAKSLVMLKTPVYNYLLRENGSIMSNISVRNCEHLIQIYHSLNSFQLTDVLKEDKKQFNYKKFNILLLSIYYAKNIWETSNYRDFYDMNVILYRKQAFCYVIPKQNRIKNFVKAVLFFISPIELFKKTVK